MKFNIKKITLGLLLVSTLTLTSCMKQVVDQKIDENGISTVSISVEMSIPTPSGTLSGSGEIGTESTTTTTGTSDMCKDFKSDDFKYLKEAKCESTGKQGMLVTGNINLKESKFFYSTGSYAIYDTKKIELLLEKKMATETMDSQEDYIDPKVNIGKSAAMGMSIKYNIEMPGNIVKHEIGVASGSTIEIDGFELKSFNKAFIISNSTGTGISKEDTISLIAALKSGQNKVAFSPRALSKKQKALVEKVFSSKNSEDLLAISNKLDLLLSKSYVDEGKTPTTGQKKKINLLRDIKRIIDDLR